MNLHFIDWIWNIRGSLALAPEQSSDDAFGRLDPLFRETGTTHERTNDMLTFRKQNQAAQDKMATFDGGVLQIEHGMGGAVLRYRLASRTLLLCFLAPLLFLAFAQLTITIGKFESASTAAAEKSKKPEKADTVLQQHPIDKALGAPAPEKPKKKEKNSPTAAYVFAALFAALYLVGRILEGRLVKSLFRKSLRGS
ncbi:hypothetical protein [Novosphingobium sp.]|uniref:hypothetical protein n=1 Tax=Novosphingobium sp. TaxID=1874826 RepID=UPI0027356B14|nr:hypothetical protein [Novosphingobium sp.]MDP3908607.1 hypothetical protein [Novosphingobium sp.]